jgi:PKD repeat protein
MSICDSGSIAVNPAVAGLPLRWSTGDTVPSIDVKLTNRYYVTMTDTMTGCVGTDSVDLTVGNSPKVNLGDDIVACNSAVLDAGIFGGFVFYDWNTTQVTQTITVSQSGSYTVTVTDFNQCTDSDTISVDILPPPAANWVAGLTPGSVSGLDIDFANLANGIGLTYSWDFGDGNTSSNADPSHTFQFRGFYIACLTVTDSCGNADQYCDTLDLPMQMVTGIELQVLENAVSVFPTPTQDFLNVEVSGLEADAIIELTDVQGRMLYRTAVKRSASTHLQRIDMSTMAEGVYFVTVAAQGQKVVRKVMRE